MVPGRYDMTIYKGKTYDVTIAPTDANGVPLDLSQYDSFRQHIRPPWKRQPGEELPEPLLSLTSENGRLTLSDDGNQLVWLISAEDTALITFSDGQYDLEMVIDGTPEVVDGLLTGYVLVKEETTI